MAVHIDCEEPERLRDLFQAAMPELIVTAVDGRVEIASQDEDDPALVRKLQVLAAGRLVGVSETAELLGVSKQAVSAGEVRGLPQPAIRVRAGPLWLFTDIARLASTRKTAAAARLNGSAAHA